MCLLGSTYVKNSHSIINLVSICICNPFARNWKNIVDVPLIIKPIYDVKALNFDEASKKFKLFNFTNENFENLFSSKPGIMFTKAYDFIVNFVGLLSGKHHNLHRHNCKGCLLQWMHLFNCNGYLLSTAKN